MTQNGWVTGWIFSDLKTHKMIEIYYEEGVSNCCGARVIEHSERCDDCQENCKVIPEQ